MHPRRLLLTALLASFAVVAPDAHAAKARLFWITGTTGTVQASVTSETQSEEVGDPLDKQTVEGELSWRFAAPRRRLDSWPTLAVPFRAREGAKVGLDDGGAAITASLTVRADGQSWVRNAPGTEDTSGRYETWSCTFTRKRMRGGLPVEVDALGGTRFALATLPVAGFSAPADERTCTESHPDAYPGRGRLVSFGGPGLRAALRLEHDLTAGELRSRRLNLTLRQRPGTTPIDCTSEFAPVCSQTATASGKLELTKQCHDGKGVAVDDYVSCDWLYPQPKRRGR